MMSHEGMKNKKVKMKSRRGWGEPRGWKRQDPQPHTNEKEQEGDQENQDENDEEENNGITYPNVKELMKMDMAGKDGIIDLLMKDSSVKKTDIKKEKIIKEKNIAKFGHVESTIGKKPIGRKKSLMEEKGSKSSYKGGKPLIYKRNEYCEYCAYAIKGQIEEENQDATKILFDENSPKK